MIDLSRRTFLVPRINARVMPEGWRIWYPDTFSELRAVQKGTGS